MKTKDIAWLAGILEGEGCFRSDFTIYIKMVDEDIIKRVACIFKRPYYSQKNGPGKLAYRVTICGSPAIEWMFTIYLFMGKRRQSKIREIIGIWKKAPSRSKDIFVSCGHPKVPENVYHHGRYVDCKTCHLSRKKLTKTAV